MHLQNKILLEFPLSCLAYPVQEKEKVRMIINYCIVEHSKKIETNIDARIKEYDEQKLPSGFDRRNSRHRRILLAAKELDIICGNITGTISDYEKLSKHISNHQIKFGKDSYCTIGQSICFDTMFGKFPYRQFAVLCAIQSCLGKKAKFKRITKDRIRFALMGFKSRSIAVQSLRGDEKLLSDRQIGIVIDILHSKGFFSRFTYANRQSFYSTRFKERIEGKYQHSDRLLFEAVKNAKIFWAKKKANVEDKKRSEDIKESLKLFRFKVYAN